MTRKKETNKKEEALSFDEAFQNLERIVEKLDEGDLPLEELEKQFEEGLRLARLCNEKLDGIEKRVKKLIEKPDGEVTAVEMAEEEVSENTQ